MAIEVALFLPADGTLIMAMTVSGTDVALFCGDWRYLWQWCGDTPVVDNVGNEAGEPDEAFTSGQVFSDNFDEDLERAGTSPGDVSREEHGIVEMKGLEETDVVKRGRYNGFMCETNSGHRGTVIDQR